MNLQGILIGTGILWALNALVVNPLTHHIVKKKLASRSRVETQKTGRRARGMLLIIEIALTVSAWRKGWRARALLPLGIGMLLAAFVAMVAASAGVSPEAITGSLILFDLAAVLVLIFMSAKAPRSADVKEAPPAAENTQADGLTAVTPDTGNPPV